MAWGSAVKRPFEWRLTPIAAEGVPLGPFAEPMSLFRTRAGRVVHLHSDCRRSRGELLEFAAALSTVPDRDVCVVCAEALPTELAAYLPAVTAAAALHEEADRDPATLESWETVVSYRERVTELHRDATIDAARSDLVDFADVALRAAMQTLGSAAPRGGLDGIIRRAGLYAVTAGSLALPTISDDVVDRQPLRPNGHNQATPTAESDAWNEWRSRVVDGHDLDAASVSAIAVGMARLGDEPKAFTQIPETPTLSRRKFSSPREWATAEWHVASRSSLTAATDAWSDLVASCVAESERRPDQLVGLRPFSSAAISGPLRTFALDVVEAFPFQVIGDLAVGVVPQVVLDATTLLGRYHQNLVHAVPALDGDTDALVVLASLWSDGDASPLAEFAAAVDAARAVLRHS